MAALENSYRDNLSSEFYSDQLPVPVQNPDIICFNHDLADTLNLPKELSNPEVAINFLSGKEALNGTHPIAQAYAGHQFGQFTMLGDGRAVLLGESVRDGHRFDIQLKGSGVTKYSRRGDGRATLSSMLREYLMSEAMHHLGIKTTRSLAVVKTGESVYREQVNDGAILTRIAESHIRVGSFEYARYYTDQLAAFTKYVIKRHDPDLFESENYALEFLNRVMNRQIDLIVDWMRVGFIHGVMNTDNMSIAGETIDYGPCAFMNAYHINTVFSSIDRQGRYAFGNQPRIAHWNLAILANALLPLIAKDEKEAVNQAEQMIQSFPGLYEVSYYKMMVNKLGIVHASLEDRKLVDELLALLQKHHVDYTNFFVSLRYNSVEQKLAEDSVYQSWQKKWDQARSRNNSLEEGLKLMDQNNPVVIPRNHLVEEVLKKAVEGDIDPFNQLMTKLSKPYTHQDMQYVPSDFDESYQTFCGT
ncbi:protein adenylyltransferase SelO [Reichenbachiella sp.]|uniref:protein adenylyltransferase SelO n=1 Tax=Reichenbachiella sp. TaxID=2184521 RepID=UPI003B593D00